MLYLCFLFYRIVMNSASILFVSRIEYRVLREEGRRKKKIISRGKVRVRFIEPAKNTNFCYYEGAKRPKRSQMGIAALR